MKHIPISLIYARLLIGLALLALSLASVSHFPAIAIGLITLGLLTDVFDGIIARQLNISTEKLRRLDSSVDQVFWGLVVGATFFSCRQFFSDHGGRLLLLLAAEALVYAVCYAKFRKEVATHAWSSKAWVLVSFAALVQVIATCTSTVLFELCFYVGLLSRLENAAILLLLRSWTNDVPTVYHAWLLRQNKPIKRHKLLNG
ncbi:hypothetical protein GCM10023185_35820 [Hymenobacter saemangeumensis]|uniref:CDP-alcohol phosphatidyltransferase family protein n=1 Tax=Hymenobacter saemangeumensis TaxID=1084522 RepID=A0ABP8IQD1_9BACT